MKISTVKVRAVVVLVLTALLVCIGGCSTTYWEYDSDYVINLNESLDEVKNDDVKIVTTYGYVMAPDVEEINTAGGQFHKAVPRCMSLYRWSPWQAISCSIGSQGIPLEMLMQEEASEVSIPPNKFRVGL